MFFPLNSLKSVNLVHLQHIVYQHRNGASDLQYQTVSDFSIIIEFFEYTVMQLYFSAVELSTEGYFFF